MLRTPYALMLILNKKAFKKVKAKVKVRIVIEQDEKPIERVIVCLVLIDLIKKLCWNLISIHQMKITNILQRLDDHHKIAN